jgi:histone H1/5
MEPLRNLPIVLISLFIVVAGVDALLALQPGILQSLRAYFSAPASGGTTSSALAAAAMIVGGVALSATTLAAFIRGVRTAPYLCITPVWVCACMLAIARLHTPLPLPVPTSAFVAISALLFVSSGVLFESTSRVSNLIGTAASLLPLTLLSIGYAFNTDAQASFGSDSFLMLFVLALAAAGAPAIAVACRANGAKVLGGQASNADMNLQVVELIERARQSEERAAQAERQLMASGSIPPVVVSSGPRLALDDDEMALSRSGGSSSWLGWAAAGVVLAATIGWYMIGVAPLRGELATAEQVNAKQVQEHTAALASMRADFERKRANLEQQLSAAAQPTTPTPSSESQPPATSPAPKTPRTIAIPDDSSNDADDADVSASREERAAKALARKEARIARKEQAAAERAEKSAERTANLAAAKEVRAQEHEARAAERAEKAAERHAKAAERAEARASTRAERSASSGSSDSDDEKADEKVERSAAAAATAALEAETYGADSSKSKRAEKTKAAPAAPPAPQKSAADVDDESSDDPLEGL